MASVQQTQWRTGVKVRRGAAEEADDGGSKVCIWVFGSVFFVDDCCCDVVNELGRGGGWWWESTEGGVVGCGEG